MMGGKKWMAAMAPSRRRAFGAALAICGVLTAGCSSTRTYEMSWDMTDNGACKPPDGGPSIQQEVTLRYVKAPTYFEVFCSNKLAKTLKAAASPTTTMVLRRQGVHHDVYSVCEVAGLKDNSPGSECTFDGWIQNGANGNAPGPWD